MPRNKQGSNFFSEVNSTLLICLNDDQGLAVLAKCIGAAPTTANIFQHGCLIIQTDTATSTNALFQNTGSSAVPAWSLFGATPSSVATKLNDTNNVTALDVGTTASAVNNLRVTNSATGTAPTLSSVGSDTNIGMKIIPKGTGGISIGGTGKKVVQQAWNYIASETGANNAIAGALTDASGTAVPLAAGLRVLVKLGHTLQAGANTFNLNAGGAVNIKSHLNVANNIATAYAATGVTDLLYDGTEWLDMSQ